MGRCGFSFPAPTKYNAWNVRNHIVPFGGSNALVGKFQGFFSYARIDAEADPKLVDALTQTTCNKSQSANLRNANFAIWRDVNNIRTGDIWNKEIDDAVRSSQVFIALVSPKWFSNVPGV